MHFQPRGASGLSGMETPTDVFFLILRAISAAFIPVGHLNVSFIRFLFLPDLTALGSWRI
jgi:hypothetical protein